MTHPTETQMDVDDTAFMLGLQDASMGRSPTRIFLSKGEEAAYAKGYKYNNRASAPAVQRERVLKDDGSREQYPLYDGLFAYFPAALCEVARWSVVGNNKHNPGEPLHWARDKSTDHENKILRHLLDARQVDKDGFVEAVALVWRSLALCQTILEERGWAEGPNARRT